MHERTKRIKDAIRKAKHRDRHKCRVCGIGPDQGYAVVGAHVLPRNVPIPMYHADDPDWIVTLCVKHHDEYDKNHSPKAKARWMKENGIHSISNNILEAIGERMRSNA